MPISAAEFKIGMRQLAAAVTVITTQTAERRAGLTASAVMSLTAEPPRLAVAVNRSASALPTILDANRFSVNVLAHDQEGIASRFAGVGGVTGEARFEGADWSAGSTGSPVLETAAASFECALAQALPFDSHMLLVGDVEVVRTRPDSRELLYIDGAWASLVRASDHDIDAFREGIEQSIGALDAARSDVLEPREKLRKFVVDFARVNFERKETTRHFLSAEPYVSAERLSEINQARRQFSKKLQSLLADGLGDGSLEVADPQLAALIIPSMVGWVGRAYNPASGRSFEHVADLLADLIVRMFSSGAAGDLPREGDDAPPAVKEGERPAHSARNAK